MTNNEKAKEIANKSIIGYGPKYFDVAEESALEMAEWKDKNPTDELIKKICKLCDKFDKDAPWQSACWCEHAEEDDWEAVYWRRIQFIKKHLKDKK